jgi:hypothetical protein
LAAAFQAGGLGIRPLVHGTPARSAASSTLFSSTSINEVNRANTMPNSRRTNSICAVCDGFNADNELPHEFPIAV